VENKHDILTSWVVSKIKELFDRTKQKFMLFLHFLYLLYVLTLYTLTLLAAPAPSTVTLTIVFKAMIFFTLALRHITTTVPRKQAVLIAAVYTQTFLRAWSSLPETLTIIF